MDQHSWSNVHITEACTGTSIARILFGVQEITIKRGYVYTEIT